jgi:thiosulfate/3-mercaptopyruvate sulfurtransferase
MNCVKCHDGAELHGSATDATNADTHRYGDTEAPKCVDCHPTTTTGVDDNVMHQSHGDALSCQVCHSITYTSCDGCHVAISEKSGNPFFETEATYPTFLIGRNPNPTDERPYQFVPVRHVPVAATSYQFYGENLLSNFNALPTWVYTTPHNIQRNTPQNESCEVCHSDDSGIFLTADKVSEGELDANRSVIVNTLPPFIETILNAPKMPAKHGEFQPEMCAGCHTSTPESHETYKNCIGCHKLEQ